MKIFLGLILMFSASMSFASHACSYSIKDHQGRTYETITRQSYSSSAACSDAYLACRETVSEGQRYGRYYNVTCVEEYSSPVPPNRPPYPPTGGYVCQTDLVDYYGNTRRIFTAPGYDSYEACRESDRLCLRESSSYDRCINRGLINGRDNERPPGRNPGRNPRIITENCNVSRRDPAGMFIQRYFGSHTGPEHTDVKYQACKIAERSCERDLKGRQYCSQEY